MGILKKKAGIRMASFSKDQQGFSWKINGKAVVSTLRLMGIGSFIVFALIATTAVNFLNAKWGYRMEALDGFWSGVIAGISMLLMAVPFVIAANYGQHYKLIFHLPMQASSVPVQMLSIVDLIHAVHIILDFFILLFFGYSMEVILIKAIADLLLAVLSVLVLYISVRISFAPTSTAGKVVAGALGFLCYIFSVAISAGAATMIESHQDVIRENRIPCIVVLCVSTVILIIITERVYKGVKNCVRLTKKYKGQKKKNELEASYV